MRRNNRSLDFARDDRVNFGTTVLDDNARARTLASTEKPHPLRKERAKGWGTRFLLTPKLFQDEDIFLRAHLFQDLRPHGDADFAQMGFAEKQHQGA